MPSLIGLASLDHAQLWQRPLYGVRIHTHLQENQRWLQYAQKLKR